MFLESFISQLDVFIFLSAEGKWEAFFSLEN